MNLKYGKMDVSAHLFLLYFNVVVKYVFQTHMVKIKFYFDFVLVFN